MRKDFALGIKTYFQSFRFIRKNGLWPYYLYPLAFIIAFAIFAGWGISTMSEWLTPWLYDLLNLEPLPGDSWWEKTLNFLEDAGKYLIGFIVWVSFAFVYYKISKYVVIIAMSPIMAFVSERTEKILNGTQVPFAWGQFFKDILRGIILALRNLVIEIGFIIILGILGLVIGLVFPPIAIVTTPLFAILTFAIGAYFYGFSTMDYTSERRKLSINESIKFIRKHKGVALANGTIFTLWLIVPIFGTYVGTIFAPITCTVGATLAIHELDNKERGLAES